MAKGARNSVWVQGWSYVLYRYCPVVRNRSTGTGNSVGTVARNATQRTRVPAHTYARRETRTEVLYRNVPVQAVSARDADFTYGTVRVLYSTVPRSVCCAGGLGTQHATGTSWEDSCTVRSVRFAFVCFTRALCNRNYCSSSSYQLKIGFAHYFVDWLVSCHQLFCFALFSSMVESCLADCHSFILVQQIYVCDILTDSKVLFGGL